jgi:hypothetical protein
MRTLFFLSTLLLGVTPASAATIAFSGSYAHQNAPAALDGRCAPAARTVTFGPAVASASGSSNIGSFAPRGSHCINPPLPTGYTDGLFSFDFGAGDLLTGTYAGTLSTTTDPQAFANIQDYLVTGGTGRFTGATGGFRGLGTVTFAPGVLPTSVQTLSGAISVAAIPEPASWAMMIVGFGAIGASLRRRSRSLRPRGVPTAQKARPSDNVAHLASGSA